MEKAQQKRDVSRVDEQAEEFLELCLVVPEKPRQHGQGLQAKSVHRVRKHGQVVSCLPTRAVTAGVGAAEDLEKPEIKSSCCMEF